MDKFQFNLKTLLICLSLLPLPPVIGFSLIKFAHKDFSLLGPFGDFFAGTTVPTLTFISFLAIVITLKMQKEQLEMQGKQLEMQNEELRNSIEEMKATRKEFVLQNQTLSIQRFENTFFQMLNLHNDIVNSLNYNTDITGREAFQRFMKYLTTTYTNYNNTNRGEFRSKDELTKIRISYKELFEIYEEQLGHYILNFFRIIKFIERSKALDEEEKTFYTGIVRAQLSSNERALLLYNSLSIMGTDLLPLMKKYNLLDNFNQKVLIYPEHFNLYEEHANKQYEIYLSIKNEKNS